MNLKASSIKFSSTTNSDTLNTHQIKASLDKMPIRDRKNIKNFLNNFSKNNFFLHLLLGEKPMCYIVIAKENPALKNKFQKLIQNILLDRSHQILRPHWESFQKIIKEYPVSKKYIFRAASHTYKKSSDRTNKDEKIIFINKKAALREIKKNWDVFKEKLSEKYPEQSFSPTSIMKNLETENNVSNFILGHSWLLGILLGFGKHNAYLFHRKEKLSTLAHKTKEARNLLPSEGFSSLKKEAEWINERLYNHDGDDYDLMTDREISARKEVCSPRFFYDLKDEETIQLLKKYKAVKSKVQKLLNKDSFIEDTILRLTSHYPIND